MPLAKSRGGLLAPLLTHDPRPTTHAGSQALLTHLPTTQHPRGLASEPVMTPVRFAAAVVLPDDASLLLLPELPAGGASTPRVGRTAALRYKGRTMGFSCGIVGLPNVGKSTLFNALSSAKAESANYPFCTIEPNIGIVPVPDARIDALAKVVKPGRLVPATIRFVDIAGLVRGASKGEGLGNQFLAHIREVEAIAHVVRCFDDPNVVHVENRVDPVADVQTIHTELCLRDLDTVNKRLDTARKISKGSSALEKAAVPLCEALVAHLDAGRPARIVQAS